MADQGWATRRQVAEHLGVSTDTVDRLVREGLPSVKLGQARRFKLARVDRWLLDRDKRGVA